MVLTMRRLPEQTAWIRFLEKCVSDVHLRVGVKRYSLVQRHSLVGVAAEHGGFRATCDGRDDMAAQWCRAVVDFGESGGSSKAGDGT